VTSTAPTLLSPEWFHAWRLALAGTEVAGSGARPTVRVGLVVSRGAAGKGAASGDVAAMLVLADGHLADVELGTPPADAPVMLNAPWPLASSVFSGETAATVAFMRGQLKTSGDHGLLLELLEWFDHPSRREVLRELAASGA
jgi:hypothetical protein